MTAWHMAAGKGKSEVLHKLWELAEEVLTKEDLIKRMFLDKDIDGHTAWHLA